MGWSAPVYHARYAFGTDTEALAFRACQLYMCVCVCGGSVGRDVSDPWEQSVCRDATHVNPAVTVRLMRGALL